jgi:hypothetical protein
MISHWTTGASTTTAPYVSPGAQRGSLSNPSTQDLPFSDWVALSVKTPDINADMKSRKGDGPPLTGAVAVYAATVLDPSWN